MKLKLIMMSAFIALGQSQAAAISAKPPLGDSGENIVRSIVAKPSTSRDDDGASTGGAGAASVAPSMRTTGTVSADRMQAVMQKCRELAAANAAQHERLTGLDSMKVALTATIMPRDKETLLEAAGRQRTVLAQLEGIFPLKEGDRDLVAAARRMMAEEKVVLEVRHATELSSVKAAHEAEIARLCAEYEARIAAESRSHAEVLGLLEGKVAAATAAVAVKEEEVTALQASIAAKIDTLEKGIKIFYRKMLTARRDAAAAQHALVDADAASLHWRQVANKSKGILVGKLPEYDPAKLEGMAAESHAATLKTLLSQWESVESLRREVDTLAVEAILRKAEDDSLAALRSPIKPRKKLAIGGAGAEGAEAMKRIVAAGSGGGAGRSGRTDSRSTGGSFSSLDSRLGSA